MSIFEAHSDQKAHIRNRTKTPKVSSALSQTPRSDQTHPTRLSEASAKAQKVLGSTKTQRRTSGNSGSPKTHFQHTFTPWALEPDFPLFLISFLFRVLFLVSFRKFRSNPSSTSPTKVHYFFTNNRDTNSFGISKTIFFSVFRSRLQQLFTSFHLVVVQKKVPIIIFNSSQIFSSSELQTSRTSTAFPTTVPHPVQAIRSPSRTHLPFSFSHTPSVLPPTKTSTSRIHQHQYSDTTEFQLQIPPNFVQIPPNFVQIPLTFVQIPPNFVQIPPNFVQIPPNFVQIPSNLVHTSSNFAQISRHFQRHPTE